MRRAALVLVGLLLIGSLIPAAAVGQTNQTNQTATESAAPDRDLNESTVVAQVDDQLRVTRYSYDDENQTMSVTLSNDGSTSSAVTMTEAVDPGSGASSFGIKQVKVRSGEEVTVEIDMLQGSRVPGIMITTEQSLANGQGSYIEVDTGWSLVDGPSTWTDVQIGVGVGIGSTIIMTMLVSWHVVARQSTNYEEVDLV